MKRIVITRFSAMGDVAMVASVLQEFQEQHENTEIILISRAFFSPFFASVPRLQCFPIDIKGKHKGLLGLWRLFKDVKALKPDFIADLHNNLRTNVLNKLFKLAGFKVEILDKGRAEKKALTRKENKILKPLKPTTERYADVLRKLGYSVYLKDKLTSTERLLPLELTALFQNDGKKVGIAAFAQHPYKVFPLTKMEQVIKYLSEHGIKIFLFGGGEVEKGITEEWATAYNNVYSTIGKYSLSEELDIISHLDLMLSMDSSGMHMASLVGTRVLSFWGATHPYAGFLGYGQSLADCIQVEHPNRPSSIYGNKPCDCDGIEAIDLISVDMVKGKLAEILRIEDKTN